jgi:HEAT repeats
MSVQRLFIVPFLAAILATNVQAQLFKRTPKPNPNVRVPELIDTLESDSDARKRESAAEELRDYDSKTFPQILPALIEALKKDNNASVRHEAVVTIGKIRPITQQAVFALDQAAQNDASFKVRVSADRFLGLFIILGHRPGKPPENKNIQTDEPPLADPLPPLKSNPALIPPLPPAPMKTSPSGSLPRPPIPAAPPTSPSGNAPQPAAPPPLPQTSPEGSPPAPPAPKDPGSSPPGPPLMPTPSVYRPIFSRPLLQLIPTKNVKPLPPAQEDGPSLNPPK